MKGLRDLASAALLLCGRVVPDYAHLSSRYRSHKEADEASSAARVMMRGRDSTIPGSILPIMLVAAFHFAVLTSVHAAVLSTQWSVRKTLLNVKFCC